LASWRDWLVGETGELASWRVWRDWCVWRVGETGELASLASWRVVLLVEMGNFYSWVFPNFVEAIQLLILKYK